jgi:preprotein translocase SecE subunit
MARDRKRSTQRRRRPDGAPGRRPMRPAPGPDRSGDPELDAAADAGLEDVLEDAGTPGSTPTPDPLKHSSAWVDEAKLGEAGVDVPSPHGDFDEDTEPASEEELGLLDEFDDEQRAPDARPEELTAPVGRRGRRSGAPVPAGPREPAPERAPREPERGGNRVFTFLRHSWEELKRVQWPDRRQVGQGTAVTLGFVVLAGGYLGLMDAIWKPVVEAII